MVDAAFAPLSASAAGAAASARDPVAGTSTAVGRRLWQAVILAAVLNVILIAALL